MSIDHRLKCDTFYLFFLKTSSNCWSNSGSFEALLQMPLKLGDLWVTLGLQLILPQMVLLAYKSLHVMFYIFSKLPATPQ